MNLFIDSLLQYSALAQVMVDIQDESRGEERGEWREMKYTKKQQRFTRGEKNIIVVNLHTSDVKRYIAGVL